jgi:hypothetical protein
MISPKEKLAHLPILLQNVGLPSAALPIFHELFERILFLETERLTMNEQIIHAHSRIAEFELRDVDKCLREPQLTPQPEQTASMTTAAVVPAIKSVKGGK